MWKISTTLLVIFVSCCDALESNASLLECEASEELHENSQEVGTNGVLSGVEYKFVVSLGTFEGKERDFFIHKCLASMVSSWNAITSAHCGEHWYAKNSINEGALYVIPQRKAYTNIDKKYFIEKFKPMDDNIAFITLAKEVTFWLKTDLPVYKEERNLYVDRMIVPDLLGYDYSVDSYASYVEISVFVTHPSKCGGKLGRLQFCVETSFPYNPINKRDSGSPLFDKNELVGLIINNYNKYGIAVRVSKSQIVRHIGPVAGKRSSVAKSSTGSKTRKMRSHTRKKNSA